MITMGARQCIAALILCAVVLECAADCYLQFPPGSNDRLNEGNADRQNDKRLFRSENNARGGYCWGPSMSFYEGSLLPIQWTSQHGCGYDNVECNMVIQYMCSNDAGDDAQKVRDGTTIETIPNDDTAQTKDGDKLKYGMHEPQQYYKDCSARERNKGLFTADRKLNGNSAQFTRQENNAQKYGFECNEESNYYPYWHPTPWKDIAVLVHNKDLCPFYKAESQNVKAKNFCSGVTPQNGQQVPNNEQACGAAGGTWKSEPAWGIKAPECELAEFSRDNHLGNGVDGETADFNWTVPFNKVESCVNKGGCSCALRVRYNISTANTDNWGFADSRQNGQNSPIKDDPNLNIEGGELTLALNTNQYGRTFQDRSHMFKIIPRPSKVSDATKIHNLSVRGKRGNIVQTFPATEYDFVPTTLNTEQGDYVHFQWTGCDTNPGGNAGEGLDKTDRSNIVQIESRNHNTPLTFVGNVTSKGIAPLFQSDALRHNMAFIGQTNCPTIAELLEKNGNNQNQVNVDETNCAKLNAAKTPYFNGGLVRMNTTGTYHYMSTRNNNFSNRSQKGSIIIHPKLQAGQVAGIVIGVLLGVAVVAAAVGFVVVAKRKPHSWPGRTLEKVTSRVSRGGSPNYAPTSVNSSERKAPLLG